MCKGCKGGEDVQGLCKVCKGARMCKGCKGGEDVQGCARGVRMCKGCDYIM